MAPEAFGEAQGKYDLLVDGLSSDITLFLRGNTDSSLTIPPALRLVYSFAMIMFEVATRYFLNFSKR